MFFCASPFPRAPIPLAGDRRREVGHSAATAAAALSAGVVGASSRNPGAPRRRVEALVIDFWKETRRATVSPSGRFRALLSLSGHRFAGA